MRLKWMGTLAGGSASAKYNCDGGGPGQPTALLTSWVRGTRTRRPPARTGPLKSHGHGNPNILPKTNPTDGFLTFVSHNCRSHERGFSDKKKEKTPVEYVVYGRPSGGSILPSYPSRQSGAADRARWWGGGKQHPRGRDKDPADALCRRRKGGGRGGGVQGPPGRGTPA